MKWSGWTQERLAAECGDGTHQTTVSKVVHGKLRPPLALVVVVERLSAEPREDGERWDEAPIRADEWLRDARPEAAE